MYNFLPGIIGQKGFQVKPVPDRREGTVFLVIFPGPGPHGSQGAIMTICVLRIRAQIQLRGSYPSASMLCMSCFTRTIWSW